ncbi:DUF992 domain-containing protein [Xanthobacter agilis]|jgi:hypothetical protein|uniref:DUF992 domain-containing protein n=1 Tax=Xanthobacter agilis TaxID=47492 RepID=A0ABU0LCF9_XANAG|nr:DUF992 domain-containing protein [Xanthobacter agilis]MDQ0504831.1 hypothetical protein [Xanthobacter agilis]
MRTLTGLIGLAALAAVSATPAAAVEAPKVQIGVLVCSVAPSVGLVLGSVRDLACELRTSRIEPYTVKGTYKGTVSRFGIDLGITSGNTLSWAVFAPSLDVGPGALAGRYVGVSANAAWAIGGGVNVLVGGSTQTVALQPLSLEGITGAAVAAGVADMKLEQVTAPLPTKAKVTK